MAHALFHDCGVSVYEVRMAEAPFILHHTERVLEVRYTVLTLHQTQSTNYPRNCKLIRPSLSMHEPSTDSGSSILQVLASPVHLQDAVSACGSVAWDCGERMLPIPEDMAPAGPLPSFHHPEAVRANTGNLGEKVTHSANLASRSQQMQYCCLLSVKIRSAHTNTHTTTHHCSISTRPRSEPFLPAWYFGHLRWCGC